jgi:negative regulator of sigma E activity
MNENSANNFERELRRRLAPVDAPAGFTERLMAALPAERKPTVVALIPRATRPARQFGVPAALAASLLAAVLFGMHVANVRALREEQEGIAASQQLMQALRVTSKKLDDAYQAVQTPPPADAPENPS